MSKRSSSKRSSGTDSRVRQPPSPLTSPSTPLSSASSVSSASDVADTVPSAQRLVSRQRNNHASKRASMDNLNSFNSMRLLPDGVVGIRKSPSGEMRQMHTRKVSHAMDVPSRRGSPYHNRPKEPMKILAPGLRETKPSSLRMIKEPEEVQRLKRKLINEAATNQDREITSPTSPRARSRQEDILSLDAVKDSAGLSPNKLADVGNVPFETLSDSEASKLHADESSKQHSGDRVVKSRLKPPGTYFITSGTEKRHGSIDDRHTTVGKTQIPTAIRHERRQVSSESRHGNAEKQAAADRGQKLETKISQESEIMHCDNLPGSTLTEMREEPLPPDDRLHETTPDFKSPDHLPEDIDLLHAKEKSNIKKSLKKKLKNPFKIFHKVQSAQVVPITSPDEPSTHKKKSAAELDKIASMFCVETPAQAGLRRFMTTKEYMDEGSCFKPAIWGCDIGGLDDAMSHGRPRGYVGDHVDVRQVECGLGLMDINNNGPPGDVEGGLLLTDVEDEAVDSLQ